MGGRSSGDGISVTARIDGTINEVTLLNNITTNNGIFGVDVDDTSALGSILSAQLTRNSVFNNASRDVRVDLDGGELNAENNYWGTAAGLLPAEVLLQDGSTIDADPFLTSDPN